MIESNTKLKKLLGAKPDVTICLTALKFDKSGFEERGAGSLNAREAKRRLLSFEACRQLLGYPAAVNPFEIKPDNQLCSSAVSKAGSAWDDSSNGRLARAEAERRDLSLESCIAEIAASVSPNAPQNPRGWRKLRLCHFAMTSNALTWDESAEAKPYRDEALRRKLTAIDCRKAMGFPVANTPE